jgi:hypothetical protein
MEKAVEVREGQAQFEDRREDSRMSLRVPAEFKVLERTDPSQYGTDQEDFQFAETENISKGGLCLISRTRLFRGDLIRVNLRFPYGPPVYVRAEVRWTAEGGEERGDGLYRAGVEFVKASLRENDDLGQMLLGAFLE